MEVRRGESTKQNRTVSYFSESLLWWKISEIKSTQKAHHGTIARLVSLNVGEGDGGRVG